MDVPVALVRRLGAPVYGGTRVMGCREIRTILGISRLGITGMARVKGEGPRRAPVEGVAPGPSGDGSRSRVGATVTLGRGIADGGPPCFCIFPSDAGAGSIKTGRVRTGFSATRVAFPHIVVRPS